jgi:hypothetical protein
VPFGIDGLKDISLKIKDKSIKTKVKIRTLLNKNGSPQMRPTFIL